MNDSSPERRSDEDISRAPEQNRQESQTEKSLYVERSSQFVGPIPPPGILDRYNQILPNAADRILSMAEKEQNHRHQMQEKFIDAQTFDQIIHIR